MVAAGLVALSGGIADDTEVVHVEPALVARARSLWWMIIMECKPPPTVCQCHTWRKMLQVMQAGGPGEGEKKAMPEIASA